MILDLAKLLSIRQPLKLFIGAIGLGFIFFLVTAVSSYHQGLLKAEQSIKWHAAKKGDSTVILMSNWTGNTYNRNPKKGEELQRAIDKADDERNEQINSKSKAKYPAHLYIGPIAPLPVNIFEKIRNLEGVDNVTPALILHGNFDKFFGEIAGIDPKEYLNNIANRNELIGGRFLTITDTNSILVNTAFAKKNKLKIGGLLDISGKGYKIVGIIRQDEVKMGDRADIYMPLSTLQNDRKYQNLVNLLIIKIRSANYGAPVRKKLKKLLPDVRTGGVEEALQQTGGELINARHYVEQGLSALIFAVLLLGSIVVFLIATLEIDLIKKDLTILKICGWSNSDLIVSHLFSLLGKTVLGIVFGIIFALIYVNVMNHLNIKLAAESGAIAASLGAMDASNTQGLAPPLLKQRIPLKLSFSALAILRASLMLLIVSMIAGLYSGWRLLMVKPAQVINAE